MSSARPTGTPCALAERLARDREELPRRLRSGDAVSLGVRVDLAPQAAAHLGSDEAQARVLRRRGGLRLWPHGRAVSCVSSAAWRRPLTSDASPLRASEARLEERFDRRSALRNGATKASPQRRRQLVPEPPTESARAPFRPAVERNRPSSPLTRSALRKCLIRRGVDTERKAGLTRFILQRRVGRAVFVVEAMDVLLGQRRRDGRAIDTPV